MAHVRRTKSVKAEIVVSQHRAMRRTRLKLDEDTFDLTTFFVEPPVDGWFRSAAGNGLDVVARTTLLREEGA